MSGWIRQLCKCFIWMGPNGGKGPLGRTGYKSSEIHFKKTNSVCVCVCVCVGVGLT